MDNDNFKYKLPDVKSIHKMAHNYINPVELKLKVVVEPNLITKNNDIENILYTKCKQYEKKVIPYINNIYILKIIKVLSYSDGTFYTLNFNGNLHYTVIVQAHIFDPKVGDYLIGCRVIHKGDGLLTIFYIDKSVYITVTDINALLLERIKNGDIVNIMIKSINYSLDLPKFMLIKNNNKHINIQDKIIYAREIYHENGSPYKKFNIPEKTIKYITYDLKEHIINKTNIQNINLMPQIKIIGKISFLWDIPFKLRYVRYEHNNNLLSTIKFNIEYTEEDTERLYGDPENNFNFKKIQEYLYTKTKWDSYYNYIINPYELLSTNKKYERIIQNEKYNIMKKKILEKYSNNIKPVSRAYYKIYEIINVFNDLIIKNPKKCITLGDAPGGFAQALSIIYPNIDIISISLANTPIVRKKLGIDSIIEYHPNILKNKQIKIDNMINKDGDLLNIKNIKYLIKKYNNSIDIIGCDAALSYFEKQMKGVSKEIQHTKILMSQLIIGLGTLKKNGFICVKLYGRYREVTAQLFYIISKFFDNMFLYKPKSSRLANNEIFVVFSGFQGINKSILIGLIQLLDNILKKPINIYIKKFFDSKNIIPDEYLFLFEKFNIMINSTRKFCRLFALELSNLGYYENKIIRNFIISEQINYSLNLFDINKV